MRVLYEYSEVKSEVLLEFIACHKPIQKYFKNEWGVVKTKNHCGILSTGAEDFYILPKIVKSDEAANLNIFIYMLIYAYDIRLENEEIASSQNEKQTILELFIQLFAKKLLREFGKGLYKEYTTEQENLTTLRGKYLVDENLKYNFTHHKIYCEYDEFSANSLLNQLFLYAIKFLLSHAKNKRFLKECELILDEVEYKIFDVERLNIHFHRLNKRFLKSYEFAILLLKHLTPLFEKDKKSFAFLFDMNELFEKFVGRICQSIEPATRLQSQKNFGNLQLKPDIIMPNLIIDTKYKILKSRDDLAVSDKYQMFVYGTNFEIKNTMLLYP
ncbi:MAG: restriction endonuclease, partial [Campylobacterales bacterium]|nr:restriction endonuclease [Campylobacterales bacterium]